MKSAWNANETIIQSVNSYKRLINTFGGIFKAEREIRAATTPMIRRTLERTECMVGIFAIRIGSIVISSICILHIV